MHDPGSFTFGPYRLLPSERQLLRAGEPVSLTPRAFDLLVALVRRAGRLATKEELLSEVWGGAFVEESNLTQNIFALRRALGGGEEGKAYIETVAKSGYRFVARVEVPAAGPAEPTPAPPPLETPAAGTLPVRPRGRLTLTVLGIAGGAALVLLAFLASSRMRPSPAPSAEMTITRLTTSGRIVNVAISPDGKYVAHAVREGTMQSLWVRQVATQSVVRLVPPAPVGYVGMTFTPDGNHIYYNVSSGGGARRALYAIPALGGMPRRVIENLRGGSVTFSPDGRHFAFVRVSAGKSSILIASADGGGERLLFAAGNTAEAIDAPAWSPDGSRIAYVVLRRDANDTSIHEVRVDDGTSRLVTARRWLRVIKLAWFGDGAGLAVLAASGDSFAHQIWQLSYPDGAVTRVTNDLGSYGAMSLAVATNTIAAVSSETEATIWVAPNDELDALRPVTTGRGRTDIPTAWTPDGRIVYHSNIGGSYDIWITGVDGGAPQQLTKDAGINQGPAVSPDGTSIVFLSDRTGAPHLWRMNLDGTHPRQLTNTAHGEQNPRFSPDGKWVVYRTSTGPATIWRVPADGGEPSQLTNRTSFVPSVSPDGKWLAYLFQDENAPPRIAVAPFDDSGGPVRTLPFPTTAPLQRLIRWTRDSRGLAFIDTVDGASNIFVQPVDGGERRRVTSYTSGRLFGFVWSEDGRQLAVSRGDDSSDIVLIQPVR